jgi:hypothetical protein
MSDAHADQGLAKAFCLSALPAPFNPLKSDEDPLFHDFPVIESSRNLS